METLIRRYRTSTYISFESHIIYLIFDDDDDDGNKNLDRRHERRTKEIKTSDRSSKINNKLLFVVCVFVCFMAI